MKALSSTVLVCLLLIVLVLQFGSCATTRRIAAGEPPTLEDVEPPPSYEPVFIRNVTTVPTEPAALGRPILEITRIDAREPNKVKVFGHLIDTLGNYLSGAANGKWKTKWCGLVDHAGTGLKNITRYSLKEFTERDRVPTAIALVMDHSGSMGEQRAMAIQDAAEKLIAKKEPEDALALIKYDDAVKVESGLTRDSRLLKSNLIKAGLLGFGGGTAIVDATAKGVEVLSLAKQYERRAVLVFTDGLENSSVLNKDSLLQAARREGVMVCVVGFGENIDEVFLQGMSGATGGMYKRIYRTNEIDRLFEDVYYRLRNYYVFEYAPPSYGLHDVTLKLCLPRDTLLAYGRYDNTPNIGDIALLDINFELDKSDLPAGSATILEDMVTLLRAYPALTIEVRGHTDTTNNTGDPGYNFKLSQRRADAVRAALIKRGIQASRITAKGYGDSQPISENDTEAGRARNRRTEFVILKK